MDAEVGQVRVPGARLYTETRGSGPLLLMVVGGSGDPGRYGGVAERLADGHTVVSWARRGFARSPLDGLPPDTEGRLAADVADAAALIRGHGSTAAVFGSSSGAIVALALVGRHPDLVRTAVVHEPPILDLLDDPPGWDARFAAIVDTYRRRGHAPAMAEFAALVGMPDPAPGGDRGTDHAVANRRFWYAHEFRQYPALPVDVDALTAVAGRIVPAAGAESRRRNTLSVATERLAARLGRPVVELPGGHSGYAEHPEAFAEALRPLVA